MSLTGNLRKYGGKDAQKQSRGEASCMKEVKAARKTWTEAKSAANPEIPTENSVLLNRLIKGLKHSTLLLRKENSKL